MILVDVCLSWLAGHENPRSQDATPDFNELNGRSNFFNSTTTVGATFWHPAFVRFPPSFCLSSRLELHPKADQPPTTHLQTFTANTPFVSGLLVFACLAAIHCPCGKGVHIVLKRLLILATPLLVAACVTDQDANTLSESAGEGRAFAQANCASCHALDDGVSPNPNAPSLRRAAHRLPEWAVEASFERGVQIGHTTEMPVFVFEDNDIANLLAYFETLREKD
jgi:cytochrome c553